MELAGFFKREKSSTLVEQKKGFARKRGHPDPEEIQLFMLFEQKSRRKSDGEMDDEKIIR